MHSQTVREFYNSLVGYAALPVLILIIALSCVIVNYLMSPAWQQKRRAKQIRKAVAEREEWKQAQAAAKEAATSDETRKPAG